MLNIQNSVTNQGSNSDVETNFTITNLFGSKCTSEMLRFVTQGDNYCYKVVSYYPLRMGRVEFDVKVNYLKRSRNIKDKLIWINDTIKSLIPWFVEAQTQANIVGKAYLVFDVNLEETDSTNIETFSISKPLQTPIQNLEGLKVFGEDEIFHSDNNLYLLRRNSLDSTLRSNLNENDVEKWITSKETSTEEQKEKIKFNIIHKSHVIEFTAFDYQDDREALNVSNKRVYVENSRNNNLNNYDGISFRLIRFIESCLRFMSFVNATLNRMHRSEAIIYKKDSLGETNQAIAKMIASTTDSALVPDVKQILKEELTNIRDSLRNFGVTAIDKKNEIDMLSRSFSGVSQLADVFYRDVISASAMTEYALFGVTSGGSGLAGVDDRDRAQLAQATDELFSNHWIPILIWVADLLGDSVGIERDKQLLTIDTKPSYKMSTQESVDVIDKTVTYLLKLLAAEVLDEEAILNEISGNGMLGKHFALNEIDRERILAKLKTS